MAGIESLVGNNAALWVNTEVPDPGTLIVGAGAAGVRYTSRARGTNGNLPRVAHVAAAGANAPTTVAVSGYDITVTLGTGGTAGTPNATAAAIRSAVNAHAEARELVTASLVGDGTGIAIAAAIAALTGGAAAGAPNYEMIALQRGLSREKTREMIDASHKGSDFTKSVPGRKSGTVSLEALEPDPDYGGAFATHEALSYAYDEGQPIFVRLYKEGSLGTMVKEEAEALVGTMSDEFPDNDISTIAIELTLLEAFRRVA